MEQVKKEFSEMNKKNSGSGKVKKSFETRKQILTIQKLANKCQSGKGDTLKQLEAINILSGDLVIQIKYLKEIRSIKDIATL